MSKRVVVAFAFLAGAMFAVVGARNISPLRAVAQEKTPPGKGAPILLGCSLIDPLDELILDRFAQQGRGFGLERVMVPGRGLHTPISSLALYSQAKTIGMFVPENEQERGAVAEIEESGLKMVFYLASRRILEPPPDESKNKNTLLLHAPLRGPVAITQASQKTDWPEAVGLREQARKAMQGFESKTITSQSEFSVGDKTFLARPVRAQESCLQCHTPQTYQGDPSNTEGAIRQLKVGDPIGVLLYAYAKSAK
jgi:hypothetical protein